ncbi:DUF2599 domain-containing protein [Cellulomonas oligotrophica]|uniref:DUF2599 domain-containing protein n=1 Tax=Cellulomonas oligotrophica TaxID=931536 RepID=A0A7Y9FEM6_9CELL|nr:DUF2599 domain-containing protein [Cellulomonas oligotrophica]NYD85844.1 hypothetical protein [Cellulomonas oligotrophica]
MPARRTSPPARRGTWLAAALGVVVVAAGCTSPATRPVASPPASSPAPSGATSAPHQDAPAPDAAAVEERGVALAPRGGPTLALLAGDAPGVAVRDDGALDVTLAATTAGTPTAWLAAPAGTALHVLADGTVAVRDEAGVTLAAVGAARGTAGAPRWTADASTGLALLTAPAGTGTEGAATAAPVTVVVGGAAVDSATWGENEGGRSLAVDPAAWARSGGIAAQEAVATQLAAAEPEAASASMRDQLGCHALGAPEKETWNLEPWRPEVDGLTMLATRCNPTATDAG